MAGRVKARRQPLEAQSWRHGEVDTAGFGGGAAGVGRHGVGERTDRRGPCISEGREKAPRMEGTTNRRKRILQNTPKAHGPMRGTTAY
jgi:hypothetical protein